MFTNGTGYKQQSEKAGYYLEKGDPKRIRIQLSVNCEEAAYM